MASTTIWIDMSDIDPVIREIELLCESIDVENLPPHVDELVEAILDDGSVAAEVSFGIDGPSCQPKPGLLLLLDDLRELAGQR